MSVLRITTLGIVVLLLEQLRICESRSCSWSKNTAVSVNSCPESKDEVEKRAKIKNCVSLAVIQNCTTSAKFQYHCLIDEAEKTLIEVCVPSYNILLGYCAEYNTVGALVQQHRGLRCSDMDPPCPQLYTSTDAYLCIKTLQTTLHNTKKILNLSYIYFLSESLFKIDRSLRRKLDFIIKIISHYFVMIICRQRLLRNS